MGYVKKFTTIAGLSMMVLVNAQGILQNGLKETISSKILEEDREVWIHLPKSYNDQNIKPAKYPVVYLLDAETNFDYYAGMTDLLSKAPYAEIPEVIVVGITNTDRTRDLTPTKSLETKSENDKTLVYPTSGGGKKFAQFLNDEIKQLLNFKYRTNGYNIIVGHSYGGLEVADLLVSNTSSYNAYILHDPSLWWNEQSTMKEIQNYFSSHALPKNKQIYLSQANNEGRSQKAIEEMTTGILAFKNLMELKNPKQFKYKYYENEGHGTVIFPANFDAIRFVFKGFATNLKDYSTKPELLMQQYKAFSEKQHFDFKPSETYLNFIINYLKRTGQEDSKKYMEELKNTLYSYL